MYVPKAFREQRTGVLHRAMRDIGAAAIVGQGADSLVATHAPIELDPEPAPLGTLRFHCARANPQAQAIGDGRELLLIFQGPQGYVTPSWYPTKQITGKVVPTWNYVAIHAYGSASVIEDPARLRSHLAALTSRHEGDSAQPWAIDDAPADFIDAMCRGIVGFEVGLDRIEGKWKMSQNRPPEDRAGVVDGLRARGRGADREMADLVEAADAADRKGNTREPTK
jgi:transcriptional regulator